MHQPLKHAFTQEMAKARDAYRGGDLDQCFHHLGRAHILGQRFSGATPLAIGGC